MLKKYLILSLFIVSGLIAEDANVKSLHKLKKKDEDIHATYKKEVLKNTKPVIVKFTATWCGPCQDLGKSIKPLAKKYKDKIKFIEVDSDEASAVADKYEIQSVPQLYFYKNGKKIGEAEGNMSTADVEKNIKKFFGKL